MPLGLSKKCSAIAPSATLAMDARAKELRSQGVNVIGFAAGEPDFETPDPIREAMKEEEVKKVDVKKSQPVESETSVKDGDKTE